MRVTDELTTLPTFQKSFDLLGCIVNIDRAFLTYYTATLIELVKEPGSGSFELLTEMLGLPVDIIKYCVNFLINNSSIGLSKLMGKLMLVVGERLFAALSSRLVNHEAEVDVSDKETKLNLCIQKCHNSKNIKLIAISCSKIMSIAKILLWWPIYTFFQIFCSTAVAISCTMGA